MADPLSIASAILAFSQLAITIKESIEKVGENNENLAALKQEVLGTVKELRSLTKGHGDKAPTGELKTALEKLTQQLKTINTNCQALTQSKGIPAVVKAWLKGDKIEAEIKKLKENRTNCCTQFQVLSLIRVERHTARTEEHAVLIEATATRTEGHAARTETNTAQLITSVRENEIRKWLQPLDDNMREKQLATQEHRHNDTGSWFLRGTQFAEWKEQPACLWIRGNSGTGKSVLSSTVINYLFGSEFQPATPNVAIAYFYFDFRDKEKQLLKNMLRTIMMQLSAQAPTPYSVLNQHFESRRKQILPTYDDLLGMLATILSPFTGTYIVLDALDECSELNELVHFISTLRGWGKPMHLLIASQPRTIFLESAAFEGASVVVLEPDTTYDNILQFVNSELELNSKLKHIKKAKDAAPKIVDKSNGMFRMAACLLQELTWKRVDANIDKILAKLPSDLFGIYTRFLQPIDEDDLVYVAALLRWLAFSARPVTLYRWVFEPENRGRVDVVCGLLEGLVTLGPATHTSHQAWKEGSVVTLAHSSVADYFMSNNFRDEYQHDLREAPSHTFLAQSCITYLLHFENNPLNTNTLSQYPLALYAAKFWSRHLLRSHDRGVLQRSTTHLLEHGSKQYAALNCVYNLDYPWFTPDWSRDALSPLYLCSKIGYVEGVGFLLDHGTDVNAVGGDDGSALQCAAQKGYMDIVRLLLENGANVNAIGGRFGNALQAAARYGRVDVVRLLLEHGADVNAVGGTSGSTLHRAAQKGHLDIVRVLLEHSDNVNIEANTGGGPGNALQLAARFGHMEIVRILLSSNKKPRICQCVRLDVGHGSAMSGPSARLVAANCQLP
ncbi:hypothetical protein DFH06DRAFT_1432481 [Mycena polygramma]|nr:hypothetical protein DFH06DRAFT_1432481 [Mycena polygramma]